MEKSGLQRAEQRIDPTDVHKLFPDIVKDATDKYNAFQESLRLIKELNEVLHENGPIKIMPLEGQRLNVKRMATDGSHTFSDDRRLIGDEDFELEWISWSGFDYPEGFNGQMHMRDKPCKKVRLTDNDGNLIFRVAEEPTESDSLIAEHRMLHGSSLNSPKISTLSGDLRVLSYRQNAFELGHGERVKTSEDDEFPGVKHVELYEVFYNSVAQQFPSLEETIEKAKNPPIQFLISKLGNLAIVSSQFGYKVTGSVEIEDSPTLPIALVDFADGEDLREQHLKRLEAIHCDPTTELPQIDSDNIFKYMFSGAKERS